MSDSSPHVLPAKATRVLAFHLPQFHPIPENDTWWGNGFTEWTNVTRGQALFKGHQQPHLPADLGFYDLRLPEARELQANLAREAGLSGFVYYHYWFSGRRLLERPVDEILRLRTPDFPFCLCWANEPWSRNWDGKSRDILMPQQYSPQDDETHINWLLRAFADDRYIKVDGRPVFLVYRPSHLPDMRRTAESWRTRAREHGFPDLFLCGVRSFAKEFCDAAEFGLDASVEFKPNGTDCGLPLRSNDPLEIGYRIHNVWNYETMVEKSLLTPLPEYRYFPGVCPMWDNSVRRRHTGTIFRESSPEKYGEWLRQVLVRENLRVQRESLVFVNAWNEWAEGNHLEPCQRWGRGYLAATRTAIEAAATHRRGVDAVQPGHPVELSPGFHVMGSVDSCQLEEGAWEIQGWCLDQETGEPPDLMAYGLRTEDGRYAVLGALEYQRIARPDVAAHHGGLRSLLAGWRWRRVAPAPEPDARPALLAFRFRDSAVALLCQL